MSPDVCLVATGAPLARRCPDLAASFIADGWTVRVALTSAAHQWVDEDDFADPAVVLAGRPSRTQTIANRPTSPDLFVVCPATFNTVGKVAHGIADTYVHSLLAEAVGAKIPMVMVPMVKHSLWNHPAWTSNLQVLRTAGVWFLDPSTGQETAAPVESGSGDLITAGFDPRWVINSALLHTGIRR